MSSPVDRNLVERLLADPSLSFREIARQAGCSDWSVRAIARGFDGDERHMEQSPSSSDSVEPISPLGWGIVAGVTALFAGVIWFGSRGSRSP